MDTDKSNLMPSYAGDTMEKMLNLTDSDTSAANGNRAKTDYSCNYMPLTIGGERFRKDKKHNKGHTGDVNPGYIELTVGGHKIEDMHDGQGNSHAENHNRYAPGLMTVGGNNLFESPRSVRMTVGGNRVLSLEKTADLGGYYAVRPGRSQKKSEKTPGDHIPPGKPTSVYSSLAASQ